MSPIIFKILPRRRLVGRARRPILASLAGQGRRHRLGHQAGQRGHRQRTASSGSDPRRDRLPLALRRVSPPGRDRLYSLLQLRGAAPAMPEGRRIGDGMSQEIVERVELGCLLEAERSASATGLPCSVLGHPQWSTASQHLSAAGPIETRGWGVQGPSSSVHDPRPSALRLRVERLHRVEQFER